MKLYKVKTVEEEQLVSISCDKCKEIYIDNPDSYVLETDNFVSITKIFGYGSKRDSVTYEIDLCEKCTIELLGKYWRKK